jgi:hypothetical protein
VRNRIRVVAERIWRGLLLNAIGALVLAAIATILGAQSIAHVIGTIAWGAAFVGAIAGLLAGTGREVSP